MHEGNSLYFAYGSNINLDQMAYRCPQAVPIGSVTLDGYALAFRAGGVATVLPQKGSQVSGLLWEITPDCERSLDLYEGYPHLYVKEQLTVCGPDGREYTVMAYMMNERLARLPSLPSRTYYDGIVAGYEQNGMDTKPLEEALQRCYDELSRLQSDRCQMTLFPKKKTKKKEKER